MEKSKSQSKATKNEAQNTKSKAAANEKSNARGKASKGVSDCCTCEK